MYRNYLLLCFLSASICLMAGTVAHEIIIGGQGAGNFDFPYQVSVQFQNRHFCGGGIIHHRFILTAAHCVVGRDGKLKNRSMTVFAGRNVLHKPTILSKPSARVEVKKAFVPVEYFSTSDNTGDIAVLELENSIKLSRFWSSNKNLKEMDLPENKSYDNKTARIAGFGWDYVSVKNNITSGGNSDKQLRYAEAIVEEPCPKKNLNKQICARVVQSDRSNRFGVCNGDSGGPLVYKTAVIGILSSSPKGCSERDSPATYTRVSYYLNFIKKALRGIKSNNTRELYMIP